MAGYLAGATNLERPFQDIVSTLPGALALYGIDTSFRSFGTRISENLPAAGQHLLEPAVYSCAGIHRENCDNSESRLDHVFEQIKAGNNDLAVVVSDLWFTNSEIRSSGLAALQPMLSDLLFSGKVIAVYGISAPFDGAIYDLPDEGTEKFSVPYTGRHPLYIVVVGSKPAVLDFDKALGNSGSKYLSEGRTNGAIQRTLFAVDPGPDAPVETAPLGKSSDSRIKLSKFSVTPGVAIQRFSMTKAPASPMRANAAGPTWVGPKPGSFLDDAVWAGPMRVRTRIWTKSGNACSAKSWLAQNEGVAGWHSEVTDGLATFTLDSKRFAAALSAKGTYLVTGEVQRTSLTLPNPRTEWMRGSWSLDPARAMMVAQRPPREFPTLNLSEFGRIMETALATAAERRNKPIIGFTFMVKVDD
ncbi:MULTISPECIES: hypothetical protein [unclassified Novosphingobium]|uniref:hypothetical protein n=1 Tax=unclassified Novosphingobium TaxID=2644732 RepID=UPI0013581FF3|nr:MULTISPECIES: hypothetical protein [unclassified Novosphingobium]